LYFLSVVKKEEISCVQNYLVPAIFSVIHLAVQNAWTGVKKRNKEA
jgi:hypothetical protein